MARPSPRRARRTSSGAALVAGLLAGTLIGLSAGTQDCLQVKSGGCAHLLGQPSIGSGVFWGAIAAVGTYLLFSLIQRWRNGRGHS